MNDAELDKLLKQGKEEAGGFFEGRFDARACETVALSRARRFRRPRTWLTGACAVAAAAVCAAVVLTAGGRPAQQSQASATAAPIAEQTVYLSDDAAYRMSYIPVDMPDKDTGMMTVLYEMGGDTSEMAYYSLFETCDTAYPALTIVFPGSDYDMLLIASGDSAAGSLGYRLVGYRDDALSTWYSQDKVPHGHVTMTNGVAVERRTQDEGETVTYIVPVQLSAPGSIALPVDALHLFVGERILLIGANAAHVAAADGGNLLDAEEQPQQSGLSAVLLKAVRAGKGVVSVGQQENIRTIDVDIEE